MEGNILVGSLVFFKIDGKWTEPFYFDDCMGAPIEEVKRAVLCLCSRDIQVGNEIQNDKWEKAVCDGIGDGNIWYHIGEEHGVYSGQKYWFKVIGEISSEATWVKEGDEFEGENVKFSQHPQCPKCGATDNAGFCPYDVECEINKKRIVAYIKGPCGHYH